MTLVLKSFGQEVDLSNHELVRYYLVFGTTGDDIRIPVPEETVATLTRIIYGADEGPVEKVAELEEKNEGGGIPEGAVEFGGAAVGSEPEEEPVDGFGDDEPTTEEALPSI